MIIGAIAALSLRAVSAHPEIEEQITHLSQLITEAGDHPGADLFLQRGELHRVHEDWDPALADFERALALDPSLAEIRCCRGRLFLDRGEPRRAVAEFTAFLEGSAGDPRGLALRARAYSLLKEYAKADADYAESVSRYELPSPELVLEWAECRLASDVTDEGKKRALAALDCGMERHGPLVTLQSRAIALECDRGAYDAALARIEQSMAANGTSPLWLKRKAEILTEAGRLARATVVYREALASIDHLPEHRRSVRAIRFLRTEIESNLALLNAPNEAKNQ